MVMKPFVGDLHMHSIMSGHAFGTIRELAAELFDCSPEQVVMTMNCTHGLNMAMRTLVKPGTPVVISGFEHNAVTRPLHGLERRGIRCSFILISGAIR